jgi:hypothetical protein
LDEIELHLFINETEGCGKAPHENIIAVSNGHFHVAGELIIWDRGCDSRSRESGSPAIQGAN